MEYSIPEDIIRLIRSYLVGRMIEFDIGFGPLIILVLTKGCPQSSCMGPLMWLIIIDSMLERLLKVEGVDVVAFADDTTICIKGGSREKIEKVAKLVLEIV